MKIIMVKKRMANGEWCSKCGEIDALMQKHDHHKRIDEVLVAEENNPLSPGTLLASRLQVSQAPFFVVEFEDGREQVYTVYLKFAKEVLNLSDDGLKQLFLHRS
ncbi:Conserved hypothetical protein [gamma proteobacterium HdN1]|nr:Conserved hypothetical protein [gamma proteobacterium HdN1]